MSKLDDLITKYPKLLECRIDIQKTTEMLVKSFSRGKRLYILGNGGSAADALHIAGELVKSFVVERALDSEFVNNITDHELVRNLQGALPAIALVENTAFATAYSNDCDSAYAFAQQVYAYVREGDCVLGISASGNSKNVINALKAAEGRNAILLGLTGADGGEIKKICDICVCVPEVETYKVQELHLPIYHTICLMLEEYFWPEGEKI